MKKLIGMALMMGALALLTTACGNGANRSTPAATEPPAATASPAATATASPTATAAPTDAAAQPAQ